MTKAEELELLDILAKKDGYANWKDYMRNHTAVFYPVGVNSLMHSFASLAVTAIFDARKEGRDEQIESMMNTEGGIQDTLRRVRLETAKEIFNEIDLNFYHQFSVGKKPRVDMPREWYDEIKKHFLLKPQSGSEKE